MNMPDAAAHACGAASGQLMPSGCAQCAYANTQMPVSSRSAIDTICRYRIPLLMQIWDGRVAHVFSRLLIILALRFHGAEHGAAAASA